MRAKEANHLVEPFKNLALNPEYKPEKIRNGDWIQSYLGDQLYVMDLRPEDIKIEDISHALSNKCRFSGMCHDFLSVAQHSWYVSYICLPENAAKGLLHDAAEAYLVDLPTPLKMMEEFRWYKDLEDKVQDIVDARFSLPPGNLPDVKYADLVMLVTERRDFHKDRPWQRIYPQRPLDVELDSWTPKQAKKMFLERAEELGLTAVAR